MTIEITLAFGAGSVLTLICIIAYYDKFIYPRQRANFWKEVEAINRRKQQRDYQVALESLGTCGGGNSCAFMNITKE